MQVDFYKSLLQHTTLVLSHLACDWRIIYSVLFGLDYAIVNALTPENRIHTCIQCFQPRVQRRDWIDNCPQLSMWKSGFLIRVKFIDNIQQIAVLTSCYVGKSKCSYKPSPAHCYTHYKNFSHRGFYIRPKTGFLALFRYLRFLGNCNLLFYQKILNLFGNNPTVVFNRQDISTQSIQIKLFITKIEITLHIYRNAPGYQYWYYYDPTNPNIDSLVEFLQTYNKFTPFIQRNRHEQMQSICDQSKTSHYHHRQTYKNLLQ